MQRTWIKNLIVALLSLVLAIVLAQSASARWIWVRGPSGWGWYWHQGNVNDVYVRTPNPNWREPYLPRRGYPMFEPPGTTNQPDAIDWQPTYGYRYIP